MSDERPREVQEALDTLDGWDGGPYPSLSVVMEAVSRLQHQGDTSCLPPLFRVRRLPFDHDEDLDPYGAVLGAILEIGDRHHAEGYEGHAVVNNIREADQELVADLLVWKDDFALRVLGRTATLPLLRLLPQGRALATADRDQLLFATRVLREVADPRAVSWLCALADYGREDMPWIALSALGQIAERNRLGELLPLVPRLLSLLNSEPPRQDWMYETFYNTISDAADLLAAQARTGDRASLTRLLSLLKDRDGERVAASIEAIASVPAPEVLPALLRVFLTAEEEYLVDDSADAIFRQYDVRAVAAVLKRLTNSATLQWAREHLGEEGANECEWVPFMRAGLDLALSDVSL